MQCETDHIVNYRIPAVRYLQ